MAKGDKVYFENYTECASLAKKAATYLVECLENYDANNIEKMLEQMHTYEHSADMKKHEMNEMLAKAFVTPVDREDLDMMSQQLDTVLDLLEEVLQKLYIYNIQTIEPAAIEYAKHLVKACDLLGEIMGEFENFKKIQKASPSYRCLQRCGGGVRQALSHHDARANKEIHRRSRNAFLV